MQRVTLRQIESFIAVAETGNFSRASRRLGIAQPALSLAIKELEAELGLRLFDRTTRKVQLTEAGSEFFASAAPIMESLQLALANMSNLAQLRRGRIKVAAPPLLASAILPLALAKFRREHPGITVEVLDVDTGKIVESVTAGTVDCGLGTFSPEEREVTRKVLARDKLLLFCPKDHGLAEQPLVRWEQLAGFPLVTLTRNSAIRLLVEIGFETAGVAAKPSYEVSHITTALAFVGAGVGISVLPTYALTAVQDRSLKGVPLVEPEMSREIALIWASGRSLSPALAKFSEYIAKASRSLMPEER
ncbi:LysR family transcriptional regulator [Rhodoligotrophos defluvii]|uniref:LysR family transcriptional regulator n=1 Tax=Rhodoligotrophos defluvii TaxID=2561934 RepID=UPI0010C99874|nr:LysR family transcriptional regulator [Rhodoligotrophos defluvii]